MKRIFSLFFLLIVGKLIAQNYDELFNLSYDHVAGTQFETTDISINQYQLKLSGGYGFILNDKEDVLNIGGTYNYLNQKTLYPYSLQIHTMGLGLDYLKHWKNPYWATTFSTAFIFAGDEKANTNNVLQLEVSTLTHYGKREELVWSFGLYYTAQPFGNWLFPLLGVDWRINDRLYFSTVLFSKIYLEYALKPQKIYIGLNSEGVSQSFVISDYGGLVQNSYITSYSEKFPYSPFNNQLFIDFYLKNYFVLFAKAGVLVSRDVQHYTSDHTLFDGSLYNAYNIPASFSFEMGFAIRVRKF